MHIGLKLKEVNSLIPLRWNTSPRLGLAVALGIQQEQRSLGSFGPCPLVMETDAVSGGGSRDVMQLMVGVIAGLRKALL